MSQSSSVSTSVAAAPGRWSLKRALYVGYACLAAAASVAVAYHQGEHGDRDQPMREYRTLLSRRRLAEIWHDRGRHDAAKREDEAIRTRLAALGQRHPALIGRVVAQVAPMIAKQPNEAFAALTDARLLSPHDPRPCELLLRLVAKHGSAAELIAYKAEFDRHTIPFSREFLADYERLLADAKERQENDHAGHNHPGQEHPQEEAPPQLPANHPPIGG